MSLKDRSRALLRAALPLSLRQQILVLMAAVTAAAIVVLSALSSARLDESARLSTESWSRALAGNAAASALPLLQDPGGRADDAALRALASLPGVTGLVVRDAQGQERLVLQQGPDGRVLRLAGATPSRSNVNAEGTVQSWSPVGLAGSLGSVGVSVSLEVERGHVAALRYDGVMALAFTGLAMLAAVYLFLARALAPLNRLVNFAGELARGFAELFGNSKHTNLLRLLH